MPRRIPLSVRITDADAAFLAQYKAEGATTPSEKLRALLADARRDAEGATDDVSSSSSGGSSAEDEEGGEPLHGAVHDLGGQVVALVDDDAPPLHRSGGRSVREVLGPLGRA